MNVASLDLCRELYELSGWDDTFARHIETATEVFVTDTDQAIDNDYTYWCPAYDLGYLHRRLPKTVEISRCSNGDWSYRGLRIARVAVSPEDAATKLLIKLFKQGVLTKENV